MYFALIATLSAAGLFFGMLICSEVGRRIGTAKLARDPEGLTKGAGAAEGAVFGLLGLLIAFTFSGAATRFEGRRHLVTSRPTQSVLPTCGSICFQAMHSRR